MSDYKDRKDTPVTFSTVKFGSNSKGNLRVQLYLKTKEDAENFAALVAQKAGEAAGTGVQLDIHETKNVAKDSGREFTSAIMFVKEKQAMKGGFGGGNGAKASYKPKNSQEEMIARLKGKQV